MLARHDYRYSLDRNWRKDGALRAKARLLLRRWKEPHANRLVDHSLAFALRVLLPCCQNRIARRQRQAHRGGYPFAVGTGAGLIVLRRQAWR